MISNSQEEEQKVLQYKLVLLFLAVIFEFTDAGVAILVESV